MTTYAALTGIASPLPQAANNPVPIVGQLSAVRIVNLSNINANTGNPLPQATNAPNPIVGAAVIAILFPTGGGNPTTSYST